MGNSEFCIDERLIRQAKALVDDLRRREITVVTAESCTGGLIAAALSHGPGASECLHGGFVVYTKAHKTMALGVPPALLDVKGTVNAEVASALASGALGRSPADVALAVTGVLGPEADEDGNPPGEIYFAVAQRGRPTEVRMEHFAADDPHEVRHAVVVWALTLLKNSVASENRSGRNPV